MKALKYIGIVLMAALLSIGLPSPAKVSAQPGISVSFQVFFNALSPFGNWSTHPQYGSIWIPSVNRDFHPYYTGGRWVMTEYGNTWVSDYDWGWAPFHYGRWFYDNYVGWAWVPDYTWGPGWVNWRNGGGHYGWAPLMPGLDIRIGVNLPINFWVFVPHRHFMSARWHRYSVPRARVTNVYQQTTIINNYYTYNNYEYAYGPRSADIQRYTNNRVPVYNYSSRGSSGNFRESVARTNNSNARQALERRERSFDSGPAISTPGSGRRSSEAVNPTGRNTNSGRTNSAPAPSRSSNPVTTPAERESTPRSTSPAIRSTTPERAAPENRTRSREAVTPTENNTIRNNSREPASRSERVTPSESSPRTRENSAPARSRRTTESRPAPDRVTPSSGRSSGPETSPGRSASPRQSVSTPSRSTSPVRSSSPAVTPERSTRGERGGRQ